MLNLLEMRKAFRAGGERGNKISLSPLQPTNKTDVQSGEEAMLLGLPAWECYATPELFIRSIKSQLKDRKGDLAPESEKEHNLKTA